MSEDLILALEELHVRDRSRAWFLPSCCRAVKFPDLPLGAGETLRDLNLHLTDAGDMVRRRPCQSWS